MDEELITILSLTDMFDNLSPKQLELVASIGTVTDNRIGDVLLRENDKTDELYIIGRGGVQVLMNPNVVGEQREGEELEQVMLAELRQGQVFGEIALVDQGMRSATIQVSQENTQIITIPRDELMLLCDTYPELGYRLMKNLAADLALKLRNTDLTIRQYRLTLSRTPGATV